MIADEFGEYYAQLENEVREAHVRYILNSAELGGT